MSLASNVAAGKASRPMIELCIEEMHKLNTPAARGRFIDNVIAALLHLSSGNLRDDQPLDAAGVPLALPMDDNEGSLFEEKFMPYGMFTGSKIGNLASNPDGLKYLVWLANEVDNFKRDLRRYLLSPSVMKSRNELDL